MNINLDILLKVGDLPHGILTASPPLHLLPEENFFFSSSSSFSFSERSFFPSRVLNINDPLCYFPQPLPSRSALPFTQKYSLSLFPCFVPRGGRRLKSPNLLKLNIIKHNHSRTKKKRKQVVVFRFLVFSSPVLENLTLGESWGGRGAQFTFSSSSSS